MKYFKLASQLPIFVNFECVDKSILFLDGVVLLDKKRDFICFRRVLYRISGERLERDFSHTMIVNIKSKYTEKFEEYKPKSPDAITSCLGKLKPTKSWLVETHQENIIEFKVVQKDSKLFMKLTFNGKQLFFSPLELQLLSDSLFAFEKQHRKAFYSNTFGDEQSFYESKMNVLMEKYHEKL